jgi:very-short-patch-repair endonuclease
VGVPERTPGALLKSDRADASAKRMRREPTYAEKRLWKFLRTTDLHFRRQAPFAPYIVDFVCHEHRLIVELDGGIHNLPQVAARDVERDLWLTGRGYRVMRFLNEQAVSDTSGVVQMILARVSADTPTPDPSPQGGGGHLE